MTNEEFNEELRILDNEILFEKQIKKAEKIIEEATNDVAITMSKKDYEKYVGSLEQENMKLKDKVEQLQDKIDSAINYIETIQEQWQNISFKEKNLFVFENCIDGISKLNEIKYILKDDRK